VLWWYVTCVLEPTDAPCAVPFLGLLGAERLCGAAAVFLLGLGPFSGRPLCLWHRWPRFFTGLSQR
jgi:hypothetical protein